LGKEDGWGAFSICPKKGDLIYLGGHHPLQRLAWEEDRPVGVQSAGEQKTNLMSPKAAIKNFETV